MLFCSQLACVKPNSWNFQRLVKPDKIIVHRVQRDRARVVFDLVSERVSTTNFAAWLKP